MDDASANELQPDATAAETLTVVEPDVSVALAGPEVAKGGDTLTYTLTLTNEGDGPAHDLMFADLLTDPQLAYVPGSLTKAEASTATGDVTAAASGAGFEATLDTLGAGETLVATYQAAFDPAASGATSFSNTATFAHDTVPGDDAANAPGREDTGSATHRVSTVPFLAKTVQATSDGETGMGRHDPALVDLVVGEEVTYALTLTLPETDMSSVVLTDTLPDGLVHVRASVERVGGTIEGAETHTVTYSDGVVTIDFGAVTNSSDDGIDAEDQIVVNLVARVADVDAAASGATLAAPAALAVTAGSTEFDTAEATVSVEVVDPALSVALSGPVEAEPGGEIAYALRVENTGDGPAHDVAVADALANAALSLVSGSVSVKVDGTGRAPEVDESSGFAFALPVLRPGEVMEVSYRATLDGDAARASSYPNTATVAFDTVPGDGPTSADARAGSGSDDHAVATGPVLDRSLAATSDPATGRRGARPHTGRPRHRRDRHHRARADPARDRPVLRRRDGGAAGRDGVRLGGRHPRRRRDLRRGRHGARRARRDGRGRHRQDRPRRRSEPVGRLDRGRRPGDAGDRRPRRGPGRGGRRADRHRDARGHARRRDRLLPRLRGGHGGRGGARGGDRARRPHRGRARRHGLLHRHRPQRRRRPRPRPAGGGRARGPEPLLRLGHAVGDAGRGAGGPGRDRGRRGLRRGAAHPRARRSARGRLRRRRRGRGARGDELPQHRHRRLGHRARRRPRHRRRPARGGGGPPRRGERAPPRADGGGVEPAGDAGLLRQRGREGDVLLRGRAARGRHGRGGAARHPAAGARVRLRPPCRLRHRGARGAHRHRDRRRRDARPGP